MVPDIRRIADLMQEIAAASREQDGGTTQVTKAVTQLDTVIQNNSAASEELAASAEELSGQAVALREQVSFFRVKGGSAGKAVDHEDIPASGSRATSYGRETPAARRRPATAMVPVRAGSSDDDFETF
jgi:methyl-accepting chemotaxis protein